MTLATQSSIKFLSRHCLALLISLSVFATSSLAAPINYLFEGNGSGSIGGLAFSDADFEFSASGDTDDVVQIVTMFSDLAILEDLAGTIAIDGFPIASVTVPVRMFNNRGAEIIGVGADVQGDLINIEDQPGVGLDTYDLTTDFGPISSSDPFFSQFNNLPTDQGLLSFTGMSRVTFSATIIPEPTTAACLLIGGTIGLLSTRRHA